MCYSSIALAFFVKTLNHCRIVLQKGLLENAHASVLCHVPILCKCVCVCGFVSVLCKLSHIHFIYLL